MPSVESKYSLFAFGTGGGNLSWYSEGSLLSSGSGVEGGVAGNLESDPLGIDRSEAEVMFPVFCP